MQWFTVSAKNTINNMCFKPFTDFAIKTTDMETHRAMIRFPQIEKTYTKIIDIQSLNVNLISLTGKASLETVSQSDQQMQLSNHHVIL